MMKPSLGCLVMVILGRCVHNFDPAVWIWRVFDQRKQIVIIRITNIKIHIIRLSLFLHLCCLRWKALILNRTLNHIIRFNHFEDLIVYWVGLLLRRVRLTSRADTWLNWLRISLILSHLDQLATKWLVSFFLQGFSLLFCFNLIFVKAEVQLDIKSSYFWSWRWWLCLLLGR